MNRTEIIVIAILTLLAAGAHIISSFYEEDRVTARRYHLASGIFWALGGIVLLFVHE